MQETTDTNSDPGGGKAGKPIGRPRKGAITQKEIDDLRAELRELLTATLDVATRMIKFGQHLIALKESGKIKYGEWTRFVKTNLPVSLRYVERCMLAAEKYKVAGCPDSEEFMAAIWGHKPKELPEGEGDTESKNDASVVSGDGDEGESKEEDSSGTTFGSFPKEEREDIVLFLEFQRMLNAYLEQPIAESAKLTTLEDLFATIYAKLKTQAGKCNQPIEEVFKRLGF
jgi:hypothetical protein